LRPANFIPLFAGGLAFGLASVARAHDFWIEPTPPRPAVGERVSAALRVGERLAGEVVPRRPNRIVRFEAVGPDGTAQPLIGVPGMDPAGSFAPSLSGTHRLLYQGNRARLELEPAKFESYLREEGLEKVVAQRAERGESGRPGREAYSRSALAAVCVRGQAGEAVPSGAAPAPLELTLELRPESDPCGWRAGDEVSLRLLFRGRPVEGAIVAAQLRGRTDVAPLSARTDAEGRVRLRLDTAGFWLLKAVEMVRAEALPDTEWESFWASLTLDLPPAP
jgi:hypothetical protein